MFFFIFRQGLGEPMKLTDYLDNTKAYVWKETYAIIKSKKVFPEAFANIIDKNEITVITEQSKYNEKDVMEMEKDFKILTFDTTLPFGLVGFLATVSKELAEADISAFFISAYSTDHILIKENDLDKARERLLKLGIIWS